MRTVVEGSGMEGYCVLAEILGGVVAGRMVHPANVGWAS